MEVNGEEEEGEEFGLLVGAACDSVGLHDIERLAGVRIAKCTIIRAYVCV